MLEVEVETAVVTVELLLTVELSVVLLLTTEELVTVVVEVAEVLSLLVVTVEELIGVVDALLELVLVGVTVDAVLSPFVVVVVLVVPWEGVAKVDELDEAGGEGVVTDVGGEPTRPTKYCNNTLAALTAWFTPPMLTKIENSIKSNSANKTFIIYRVNVCILC